MHKKLHRVTVRRDCEEWDGETGELIGYRLNVDFEYQVVHHHDNYYCFGSRRKGVDKRFNYFLGNIFASKEEAVKEFNAFIARMLHYNEDAVLIEGDIYEVIS